MNALNDASHRLPALGNPCTGGPSCIVSGLKSEQVGETVDYIPDPMKHWFVLKVLYGRSNAAHELLAKKNIHHYRPLRYEVRKIKGKQRYSKTLFFPSLMFVYVEYATLDELIRNKKDNTVLTYYYDHFAIDSTGKNPPLTIPRPVMDNFIRLTSVEDEHIRLVDPKACRYKRGDTVIVTKGTFKGVIGRLARVSQEQRVVMNMEGVGMIATAYIPTAFIEAYDEWPQSVERQASLYD